jgi:secreted trypsin-like serine protease
MRRILQDECILLNIFLACGVTIPTERKSGVEIAGGTIVAHGEHPWVVRIVKTYPDGTTLCGGTILNSMNILTAAHCFKDTE